MIKKEDAQLDFRKLESTLYNIVCYVCRNCGGTSMHQAEIRIRRTCTKVDKQIKMCNRILGNWNLHCMLQYAMYAETAYTSTCHTQEALCFETWDLQDINEKP